ncbi:MAG: PBP1A family penicillin-binding protein [Coriobacteriia bacterium]|nr:PBP1A family penicillin-binding protein [Coriobacteriia bacterium]
MASAVVLAIITVSLLAFAFYLDSVAKSLPDMRAALDTIITEQTTVVYAADGTKLAEWHGEQDRTVVPYEDIPLYLRDAVVAVEDKRFYEHHGIDPSGILRALKANTESGKVEQGGSTITQQVVKNLFTNGRRTMLRKVQEALMANALEARADKAKVMELYLNTVYLGRGYYGVESAARRYFGKPARELTLAESATIAGIIKSPTRYCPLDNPDAARIRRDLVLNQMAEQRFITKSQLREAEQQPIVIAPEPAPSDIAPYFVEYVKQDLIARFGAQRVYTGGLQVYTSLDPAMQKLAEKAAARLSQKGDPEVALVAVRHSDGQVLAMVGGRDFSVNQFNLAVQGRRQPGSAFKPFVLAAALQKGIGPAARYNAAPYTVRVKDGIWNVQNYENTITAGRMTLNAATMWSVNAVFARLIMQIGPNNVVQMAKKMGITTPLDPDPAIALGGLRIGVSPLEMASAYGTIANAGMAVRPSGVERVLNDAGEIIYEPNQAATKAMDRPAATIEARMLHDVVQKGTGVKAKIGPWAAGKTGTTQSYRDAWFVGWSSGISTAVWVGHRDGQVAMTDVHGTKVSGGSFPAMIWADFMKGAVRLPAPPTDLP